MAETGLTTLDKREITGRRLLTQHSALKGSVINYPDKVAIVDIPHGYRLNFRTRLSLSIYLFFNNKRRYFAMQVATLPHKLAAVP
jgi:hypothetical protein